MSYIYIVTWCFLVQLSTPCEDTTSYKTCYKTEMRCEDENGDQFKKYYAHKTEALIKINKLGENNRSFNGYIKITDIKLDSIRQDSINILELIK